MFRAELQDTGLLKDCLQAISGLISEGTFLINDEGIELMATDPAMVAMVDFTLNDDAFDTFEAGDDRISLNIEDLYSIIRRANANDSIRLELNDEESQLVITIQNGSTRRFSLPLLNLEEGNIPDTQNLDFSAELDIKSSVLSDGFGDASVVADAVTMSASGDEMKIESRGNSSHVEFTLPKGSDSLLNIDVSENARSMFSLDYLNKVMKASKLSENVKVRMGTDFPARFEFRVPEKAELNFVLAPRIEEE